jgi:hypothetical protein
MKYTPPPIPKASGGRYEHCDYCPKRPGEECPLGCASEVAKVTSERDKDGVVVVGPFS